jgi:hypothetical protein
VSEKPTRIPWLARNSRDRERMQTWVNAKLDEAIAVEERKFAAGIAKVGQETTQALAQENDDEKARRKDRGLAKTREWQGELALEQAEQGNLEPLRKQYPGHAQFINRPRRKRGQRFKKKPPPDHLRALHCRLEEALSELPLIRDFWKKHYGKTNRPEGQLTAEEIVAERWNLNLAEVSRKRISRKRLKRAPGDR